LLTGEAIKAHGASPRRGSDDDSARGCGERPERVIHQSEDEVGEISVIQTRAQSVTWRLFLGPN